MPQYRNPFEKGDLYIKFDVQFPENNWINPDKLSVSCFAVPHTAIWMSLLLLLALPCFLCAAFLFLFVLFYCRVSVCTVGWPRTHGSSCFSLLIVTDVTNHAQLF